MFSKIRFCGRHVDETALSEQAESGHAKSDDAPDYAIGAAAESAGPEPDVDGEHQGADAEATPPASNDIIASDENDQRDGCFCGDLTSGGADSKDGVHFLEDNCVTAGDRTSVDTDQVGDRDAWDSDDSSEISQDSSTSEDVPSVKGAPHCAASSLPFEAAGCGTSDGGNLRELADAVDHGRCPSRNRGLARGS